MKIDFTEIFCHVDDFFKELDAKTNFITDNNNKPGCKSRLNRSEIITIIIGYWQASYDCFKNYYLKQIWVHHQRDFQVVNKPPRRKQQGIIRTTPTDDLNIVCCISFLGF